MCVAVLMSIYKNDRLLSALCTAKVSAMMPMMTHVIIQINTKSCSLNVSIHCSSGEGFVITTGVGVNVRKSKACAHVADADITAVKICTRRCKMNVNTSRKTMHGIGPKINHVSMLLKFGKTASAFAI
jgi:hypothetical protein